MTVVRLERRHAAGRDERPRLPEEVEAYVRELIVSGSVRPGEFLRMERIAEAVGVSNTPVRQGLLALHSEGFVRLIPRRGFVVSPFTRQDVRDLFWAQAELAGELAARAAATFSDEQLDELQAVHALHLRALAADDHQQVTELGHEFHRIINRAARAQRLALLLRSVVKRLPDGFYATIEGQVAATGHKHEALVAALRNRDPDRAAALMREHVLDGADHLVAALEVRGLWGNDERG